MLAAVIDIGTNSVRCDIRNLSRGKSAFELLYREKSVIRLGKTVFLTGEIDDESLEHLLHALAEQTAALRKFNVERVRTVATSAMREAKNSSQIMARIKAQFGLDVEIISGDREAELIATGILALEQGLPPEVLLFDIGGGSTEFSYFNNRNKIFSQSLELGALRAQQVLLLTSPPDPFRVAEARHSIRKLLSELDGRWKGSPALVGSSGSIKALSRINQDPTSVVHQLSLAAIDRIVEQMLPLSQSELAELSGMEPNRRDIVLAGGIIAQEILNYFGAAEVTITEYSLRDGVFEEIQQQHR